MGLASFLRRASYALQYRLDRVFAEPRNRKLEMAYRADRETWLVQMEAAIKRGATWFGPQADLTMSAILVLEQALQQTGNSDLQFVDDRIAIYQSKFYDPGLRVVRRDYDAERHRHLPDIMDIRPYQVIELMMIDAANADQVDAVGLVRYLRALADNGNYGSTHIVVGGLLMKRAGVELDGQVDQLIQGEVDAISAQNTAVSYVGDLFAERVFVLEWLGRHDLVSPAWALRLLKAQRHDGGWRGRNVPPYGQSNQHTTSLAMAALAQFVWAERCKSD